MVRETLDLGVMESRLACTTRKLLEYCRSNNWAGHDPYDALNSPLLTALRPLNSKLPRIALIQALKRSPIDLRPLLRIPKTQNAKALGLFLSSFVKLAGVQMAHHTDMDFMIKRLVALRSKSTPYFCWGYNFPWQTRTDYVPTGAPNLVCTVFVGNALLDAYEVLQDPSCLSMAESAAEYIHNELYWEEGEASGFSYPLASLRSRVHNANLLASALLCRVYSKTGRHEFLSRALGVARYAAGKQEADGSWFYGEQPKARWIDNFHTGYNLGALRTIGQSLGSAEFERHVRHGFEFYRQHFFESDGSVRYFHDRRFPIDIHCVAQSIITLLTFSDLGRDNVGLAHSVLKWAMDHMWDDAGFFHYRLLRTCQIRTSYMRWSQAWMLLAMSTLLNHSADGAAVEVAHRLKQGSAND